MVGSDKERPKGRVGSGSDNARGSPILKFYLNFSSKQVEKRTNIFVDDIWPASVYFAKLMRTLEDGLSCFNDPFENCETWIIMIQANQFGTQWVGKELLLRNW